MRFRKQQSRLSLRGRSWRMLLVAALVPVIGSCEEVVVTPAQVATVEITPEEAEVGMGGTVHLSAVLKDVNGRTVTGHPVAWTSDDETIATVSSAGLVLGVGTGSTTIRGQAGSIQGTAVVRVLTAPSIVLSRSSVEFVMPRGDAPPPSVDVAITNSGQTDLTGLNVAVSYGAGASGWLSAALSRTTAPATLTLGVVGSASLEPGRYEAAVTVAASSAPGSAASVVVSLEVTADDSPPPPPSAPSNLAAQFVAPDRIRLSWSAGDGAAREFRIERRIGSSSFQPLATVGTDSTTFVDSGLTTGGEYRYRVQACNNSGCSQFSNQATVEVAAASIVLGRDAVEFTMSSDSAPPPPAEVSITNAGAGSLTGLSVSTQYGAGASGWLATSLSGTQAPATLAVGVIESSGLDPGRYEATVVVSASSAPGVTASLVVSLVVQDDGPKPLPPSGLSAELDPPDRIALAWTAGDDIATEFRIERRIGEGDFQALATVSAGNTAFVDTGVTTAGQYTYRVRACNESGCSEFSNQATVAVAAASIVLGQDAIEFTVAADGDPPAAVEVSVTNGGVGPLTGLSVTAEYGAGAADWLSTSLSQTQAPATLTVGVVGSSGLDAGQYEATVVVSASALPGLTASLVVSLEVEEGEKEAAPLAPVNLSAQLVQPDQIALSWTPQDDAASEFRIERRIGDGSFQSVASVGADDTGFVDSGLSPESVYSYRVRACNDAGCSEYSNQATVATPPAAPSNLSTPLVQKQRVRVAWTINSTAATSFTIERATGSAGFSSLATVVAEATFYDDRSVDHGTTYSYRVRACNSAGCSAPSNTVTVTTPD
jgi:uncharacterized protein